MSTVPEQLGAYRPTWAEIDLAAFARNVSAIRARLPQGSRLIAVLKANAYGHGAVELARRVSPDDVAMIATALLEEAVELRRGYVGVPLLVLGPLVARQVPIAIEHNITFGVIGPEELAVVCAWSRDNDREVTIHLKLDSGMGRMGVIATELPAVIELLRAAPKVKVAALYTHFANASDPTDSYTNLQINRFEQMAASLRAAGISPRMQHLANSAATMRNFVSPGDFVRVGVSLYGAEALDSGYSRLEPVMRWRTEIARLKELPPGSAIGYGTTFTTTRPSRIATLPVGYADGYNRRLSNRGEVIVRGRRVPVVGRVSMDLVTIDVTDVPDAAVGEEAVLLGRQGDEAITAEEIAGKTDTISYEVFCAVSARVPRIYRDDRVLIRSRFDEIYPRQ
jgi:alanine racemase